MRNQGKPPRAPSDYAPLISETFGPNATPLQLAETVGSMLEAIESILAKDDDNVEGALVVLKLCKGTHNAMVGMLRSAH